MTIALRRFLVRKHSEYLYQESTQAALTRLIPLTARGVPGLSNVDICFAGSSLRQEVFLRYRLGMFMYGALCKCDQPGKFRRGHERCSRLQHTVQLSRSERKAKREDQIRFGLDVNYTDIDYLLNTGQSDRAWKALVGIRAELLAFFHENQGQ